MVTPKLQEEKFSVAHKVRRDNWGDGAPRQEFFHRDLCLLPHP